MNKEHLRNKIWYRTLKVLFFGGFIFVQLLSLYITFSVTSSTREFVKCNNGKEFENPYYGPDFYKFGNEADLTRRCENSNIVSTIKGLTGEELNALPDFITDEQMAELEKQGMVSNIVDFVPDKLPYSKHEKAQYAPIERGTFLFGSIVIVSFAFWFLARIFFYIIVGEKLLSLKRQNNNQN